MVGNYAFLFNCSPADQTLYYIDRSKAVLILWILFVICYFMFIFDILSGLFLVALLSSAVKGATSWLSCMLCFCHFPIWCSRSGMILDCVVSLSTLILYKQI